MTHASAATTKLSVKSWCSCVAQPKQVCSADNACCISEIPFLHVEPNSTLLPCRAAFDRLTEYSSLLLQHGDYDIHSTPREQIASQLDAGEAAELQAVMGILSTAEQPTEDQSEDEQPAADQPPPTGPEENMFGETETHDQVAASSSVGAAGQTSAAAAQANQQTSHEQPSSSVSHEQPSAQGQFTFDESNGTWFNADLGYYYDAAQELYGDAASGHWYSYKDGAYQLVC